MKQLLTTLLLLLACTSYAQDPLLAKDKIAQQKWVDSVYNSLSLEQRVGQLFMVDAFSSKGEAEFKRLKNLVDNYHIGGIIFSKGTPSAQAEMHNKLQSYSKIPMLIAMDAEWGLSMRLDNTFAYPWNMTLGAVQDQELIEKVGAQISRHCNRLGVHINFAPVIDINTNPINPIIGNRSFGETKEIVTNASLSFMNGMHSQNVLSCGKHFPGHGDTDKDSHKTLPSILFSEQRIKEVELYPYRKLINEGLSSIMIAHLNIPSLVKQEGLPSSLSYDVVTKLLKEELGFNGLIFTDALNMKGAANFKQPGDIDVAAFKAGNDVLLISEDVPKALKKIVTQIKRGKISKDRLAHSVKKILKAKYKVGLYKYCPIDVDNIVDELNTKYDDNLYQDIAESSLTLIKNNQQILPINKLNQKRIAFVPVGDASYLNFENYLNKYTKVDRVNIFNSRDIDQLKQYNLVIIGYHKSNANPWKNHNLTIEEQKIINQIAVNRPSVLVSFAKPYAINNLEAHDNLKSIVVAYQNHSFFQEKAAQALFGGIGFKGKLPVGIAPNYEPNHGILLKKNHRLSYSYPESVNMDSNKLSKIDSIVNICLEEKMTPGLQLLIARKGKVIFNKNYGYQTYDSINKITDESIYDLASLTKILATLPVLMKLEEEGKYSLDDKLKKLLPYLKKTNKSNITFKEALSHYGKLKAWIPFYTQTLDSLSKKPSNTYYSKVFLDNFKSKVADSLFVINTAKDSINKWIIESDLRDKKEYKYSDLAYYFMKDYIEAEYKNNLNQITTNDIYSHIGANNTSFLPLQKFDRSIIVPTELDAVFRYQKIQGYVHDQGAAMLGGIGGHAGLFANANDVAKIMQMYLNGGIYGDYSYLKPETISKFNSCYYCEKENRRGVGFDKPQLGEIGPTCGCVPMESFGHSGFTGTYTWADPKEEIIYVFLSNRTFPDANNRLLIKEDIRTKIQKVIYDAIID